MSTLKGRYTHHHVTRENQSFFLHFYHTYSSLGHAFKKEMMLWEKVRQGHSSRLSECTGEGSLGTSTSAQGLTVPEEPLRLQFPSKQLRG